MRASAGEREHRACAIDDERSAEATGREVGGSDVAAKTCFEITRRASVQILSHIQIDDVAAGAQDKRCTSAEVERVGAARGGDIESLRAAAALKCNVAAVV